MIFLWIAIIIIALTLLKYLVLILRRIRLVVKIKKKTKAAGGSATTLRSPLYSVFRHDGKEDIQISFPGREIKISVITTSFHRVRYHFVNNESMWVVLELRTIRVVGSKVIPVGAPLGHNFTLRKYKIVLDESPVDAGEERYAVLHPLPIAISAVKGATVSLIYNDDAPFGKTKICGLSHFLDHISGEPETEIK